MKLKTIKDIKNLSNKRVLVRVDYNVSLDKNDEIANTTRITQTLPTINYLVKNGAMIILMSHFGRPGSKIDNKYSFKRILPSLNRSLGHKAIVIDNFWENKALAKSKNIKPGQIAILENTRFHPGETTNSPKLAKHLSKMADIFVNENFGSSHRIHASTVGVAKHLPAYAGLLLNNEVNIITKALSGKKGKLCVIIGGAKTPEKIGVIESLLDRADSILLGGAVANTFLSTWGHSTGTSMVDYEMIEMARQVIWKASQSNVSLHIPEDVVVSNSSRNRQPTTLDYKEVPGHLAIYDIGRQTISKYKEKIMSSDRIIWNGPMGLFEDRRFAKGTNAILKALVKHKGTTIIGGGDTLTTITNKNTFDKITHISTGGGAMLEFLEKGTLPGIEIVKSNG